LWLKPKSPPVATKDEAMVDVGFQVLPHDSPHAITGNQNGVPTNQQLEPVIKVMGRCRAELEQHVAGTITDIEKGRNRGSTPMSHCCLEILRLIFKLILVKTMVCNLLVKEGIYTCYFQKRGQGPPNLPNFHELQEVDAACLQGHVDGKSLLGRDSVNPGSARDDSCSDTQKVV